jgi:flagellar motor protein MotB
MAGGWGEFRPAVANNANGNTPANRRVEIYLAKLPGNNEAGNEPIK